MARWDSPLFTVAWDDAALPLDEIWATLTTGAKKKANTSTVPVRLSCSTFSAFAIAPADLLGLSNDCVVSCAFPERTNRSEHDRNPSHHHLELNHVSSRTSGPFAPLPTCCASFPLPSFRSIPPSAHYHSQRAAASKAPVRVDSDGGILPRWCRRPSRRLVGEGVGRSLGLVPANAMGDCLIDSASRKR